MIITICSLSIILNTCFSSYSTIEKNHEIYSLWNAWMLKYNKNYETKEELEYRFNIFSENYQIITDWNAQPNTATLALNLFADLSSEEFSSLYTNAAPITLNNHKNFHIFEGSIPNNWDWRTQNAVTPIKNQELCPASYLFATVAALESYYFINGGSLTALSEQQVLDCALEIKGCNGLFYETSDTFEYAQTYGLEPESEYPYVGFAQRCSFNPELVVGPLGNGIGYVQGENMPQLKAAVYQQPTTVVIEVDQPVFKFYSKGVITTGCGPYINAVATVVGYGNEQGYDSFYVKNSWGTDWGVEGYVYISTNTTLNNGFGACGILEVPIFPIGA